MDSVESSTRPAADLAYIKGLQQDINVSVSISG